MGENQYLKKGKIYILKKRTLQIEYITIILTKDLIPDLNRSSKNQILKLKINILIIRPPIR
ncbi:hypothetical protein GCM10007383_17350 [Arenibacter certesii]|uniref:Uncharacterized protein n=1 Tax=Arenibacter certesii TaxID=228955 RepID=A0A918IUT6_9FLAO|nr:hypothetical protein GCM10007383_17350 [Arenibacter certesii]